MYKLEIIATDQGSPARDTTATATVTVTDVNDNKPYMSSPFIYHISENSPNSTKVGDFLINLIILMNVF